VKRDIRSTVCILDTLGEENYSGEWLRQDRSGAFMPCFITEMKKGK
jgi:hypothetical protein